MPEVYSIPTTDNSKVLQIVKGPAISGEDETITVGILNLGPNQEQVSAEYVVVKVELVSEPLNKMWRDRQAAWAAAEAAEIKSQVVAVATEAVATVQSAAAEAVARATTAVASAAADVVATQTAIRACEAVNEVAAGASRAAAGVSKVANQAWTFCGRVKTTAAAAQQAFSAPAQSAAPEEVKKE